MVAVDKLTCVAPTADICGEGAVWHAGEQALYWADFNCFLIHRFKPRHGCVRTWSFDELVTALVLTTAPDTLIAVLGSRVILWMPASDFREDLGFHSTGGQKFGATMLVLVRKVRSGSVPWRITSTPVDRSAQCAEPKASCFALTRSAAVSPSDRGGERHRTR